MVTPQQQFTKDCRKLHEAKAKHHEYYAIYERKRKIRMHILQKIKRGNVANISAMKDELKSVTNHMEEARGRSINMLKDISALCEAIEVNEILHELDRTSVSWK